LIEGFFERKAWKRKSQFTLDRLTHASRHRSLLMGLKWSRPESSIWTWDWSEDVDPDGPIRSKGKMKRR
jgi:hypothetical protein